MTYNELKEALKKLGLDGIKCNDGTLFLDKVIKRYGEHILNSKSTRCEQCYYKERGTCSDWCELKNIPNDATDVAMRELTNPMNEVALLPFVCMFVIPLFEEESGKTGTMDKIAQLYRKMMKKKMEENK